MAGIRKPASDRPSVRRAAILLCVLLASLWGGPAFPREEAPLRLRAIVRPKYPLLFTRGESPDRPVGMAIDLVEAIASRSGITLSWVIVPGDADVMKPLLEGEGDFIADWGQTEARSLQYEFSEPYLTLPVNVYARKGSTALQDARRLTGLHVGVVRLNVSDEILSPRTDLRIERYGTIYEALFHLLSGDVDAVAHLGPILLEEARAAGIEDKIVKIEPSLADSPRCFVVRKGNSQVLARLNRGLGLLIDSPDYRRILLKWFPPPTPYWTPRRILAMNAAGFLLAMLALVGWHYRGLVRMNKALAESRGRFRSLVETTCDIVWEIDANAAVTYASPRLRDILGYDPDEMTGKPAFDLLAPGEVDKVKRVLEEAGQGRKPFDGIENVFLHRSGRRVVMEGSGVPFYGPDGALLGYRGIHRDVTARKRLEEELRRSETERLSAQKYQAVGKLAAGMAHHINNLMMIVSGYGSLLLRKMDPLDPQRKELREILSASERAASITAQLLSFGSKSILVAKVEAVDAIVEGLVPSLRTLLGDGIELAVLKESAGAAIRVDCRQFEAAIEELARNARDAMPAGGRLAVTTGIRTIREPVPDAGYPVPGRYATVSVADTGCGMDQEALSHLFEPFFTTKVAGRGLGLPSVYGFVRQSSGLIEVDSSPDRGTEVRIGLPVAGATPGA